MSQTFPISQAANALEHAASSYLRSAQHQPVQWHPWGADAFARAQAENKPILLDIGAVWCHWCHVMDRESYEDAEIAQIINTHFIAIKVDRDERPDVDTRYQAAVAAISGQGGWPLTAFLTPDGRPYFGGTYFPRDDRYGRPGFGRVLLTMANVWHEQREQVLESAASIMSAIEHNESFSGRGGELTHALTEKVAASVLRQFDPRHGGFGSQPKFPHPAALDLLLHLAVNRKNEEARKAFTVTLQKMSRGGVYDQLPGGFHRYSVDEHWTVPHFEKMLYDNTELLRNFIHGFQSLGLAEFEKTAREIIHWLDTTMTDRERGGFYASQDADINLDDDGDYFTWTLEEACAVLNPEELEFASRYWDIGELGDMHHNPAKNVLHVKQTLEEIAAANPQGPGLEQLHLWKESSQRKLLAARTERSTPFIDRTLYTGWNAMAVTAYLESASVLHLDSARRFGLLTLDRILSQAWDGGDILNHVIAYPNDGTPAEKAPGTLDDYAFTVHACIDGWLASGEGRYFDTAIQLADVMIARFYDRAAGAFYDAAQSAAPLGVLSARRKPVQDAPTPAGNPVAVSALLRLESLSGRDDYRAIAEDTLAFFAGVVEHFGLYAGSYSMALERLLLDPLQIVVVGEGEEADNLEEVARRGFAPNKTVIRTSPRLIREGNLPEHLRETLVNLSSLQVDKVAFALVCRKRSCLPPMTDPSELQKYL